jgi:hypothetical protein
MAVGDGKGEGETRHANAKCVHVSTCTPTLLPGRSPLPRILSLILIFVGNLFVFFAILGVQTYRSFGSTLGGVGV